MPLSLGLNEEPTLGSQRVSLGELVGVATLCILVGQREGCTRLRESARRGARPSKPVHVNVREARVCPGKGPEAPQRPLARASDEASVCLPQPWQEARSSSSRAPHEGGCSRWQCQVACFRAHVCLQMA